jgi:hypothetical protein
MSARSKPKIYKGFGKSKALSKAMHSTRIKYGRVGIGSTGNKQIKEYAKYNYDSRVIGSSDRGTTRYTLKHKKTTPHRGSVKRNKARKARR